MSDIRFRAWDKKDKRMFKVKSLIWTFVFLIEEDGVSQRHGSGETELMQFTGLKDKNGKEIYEGDIVKHEPDIEGNTISTVGIHSWCGDMPLSGSTDDEDYRMNVEVIGNIYENSIDTEK